MKALPARGTVRARDTTRRRFTANTRPAAKVRVAAIALRSGLGSARGDAVARALDATFADVALPCLAVLPGVNNDGRDGDTWARAVRAAARASGVFVLFESVARDGARVFRAYDPGEDKYVLGVTQLFATSKQADLDPRLVDAVLRRSQPGGSGCCSFAGWGVGLLVCGENNVLRNQQARGNAVSVRGRASATLFEGTRIVCNGAHTPMGNWGKLDRRFEFLSSEGRCALYATNCEAWTWASACRAYVDGRLVANGEEARGQAAHVVVDERDTFRAVAIELHQAAGGRRR